MKKRIMVIVQVLAAALLVNCGDVFNSAIDDITLEQQDWFTFLGSSGEDEAKSIQQTSDGGYIMAGSADATFSTDLAAPIHAHDAGSNKDIAVVKLDKSGNVSWHTYLGGTGYDQARSIQQTSDGGYILAGLAYAEFSTDLGSPVHGHSSSGTANDMVVVKLDKAGNVTWHTFLGGSASDYAQSIQQTSDGGYIVGGRANQIMSTDLGTPIHGHDAGSVDIAVVKLDKSGNVSWHTYLGGSAFDLIGTIQQTSDGGYILTGSAGAAFSSDLGAPINGHDAGSNLDMAVVKLDKSGNVIWHTFIGGAGDDWSGSARQITDGGYILEGYTNAAFALDLGIPINGHSSNGTANDMAIVKLDKSGNVTWHTFLGGSGDDVAYSIEQTADSGYIVAGTASAVFASDFGTPFNPYWANSDMAVVKLDKSGNVIWHTFLGGSGDDNPQSIQQAADGGYILAGYSDASIASLHDKEPILPWTASIDIVIIKLRNNGEL